jgi:hypothetical protein
MHLPPNEQVTGIGLHDLREPSQRVEAHVQLPPLDLADPRVGQASSGCERLLSCPSLNSQAPKRLSVKCELSSNHPIPDLSSGVDTNMAL